MRQPSIVVSSVTTIASQPQRLGALDEALDEVVLGAPVELEPARRVAELARARPPSAATPGWRRSSARPRRAPRARPRGRRRRWTISSTPIGASRNGRRERAAEQLDATCRARRRRAASAARSASGRSPRGWRASSRRCRRRRRCRRTPRRASPSRARASSCVASVGTRGRRPLTPAAVDRGLAEDSEHRLGSTSRGRRARQRSESCSCSTSDCAFAAASSGVMSPRIAAASASVTGCELAQRADQRGLVLLEAPALEAAHALAERGDRGLGVEPAQRRAPVDAALELGPAARVAVEVGAVARADRVLALRRDRQPAQVAVREHVPHEALRAGGRAAADAPGGDRAELGGRRVRRDASGPSSPLCCAR